MGTAIKKKNQKIKIKHYSKDPYSLG